MCSGTQAMTNSFASSVNLTQLSNLTNAWQLDPVNLTEQYGLHIYGSGSTTGLVVDSGSDQVRTSDVAALGSSMLICMFHLLLCMQLFRSRCTSLLLFVNALMCCILSKLQMACQEQQWKKPLDMTQGKVMLNPVPSSHQAKHRQCCADMHSL